MSLKIKQGDTVQMLSGKDRGKQGRVLEARPRDNKVIVENLNLMKRHQKPRPMRVGSLQVGHTSITFDTETAAGRSTMPPGAICVPPIREASRIGRGFWWRFIRFRFSTMTLPSRGRASRTRPCLPRSLPVSICTVSPFLIFNWVAI